MMHAKLAFLAVVTGIVLSGADGAGSRVDEPVRNLRGEHHFQRRLQGSSCGGWSSEGDVDISGDRYKFSPGSGSSSRAERKREGQRAGPTEYSETLNYSGSISGAEAGTGFIIFQYHGDGDGPNTAAKVYLDGRDRTDGQFDLYLRCWIPGGDGDEETGRLSLGTISNGENFSIRASIDTSGTLEVNSRSCELGDFPANIYPKFGLYNQGGSGSYSNAEADFTVSRYSCS